MKIESLYCEDDVFWKRIIDFDLIKGIKEETTNSSEIKLATVVKLINFKEKYRSKEKAYKTPEKISQRILEHFLSFFVMDKQPRILIKDDSVNYVFNLNNLFLELKKEMHEETFQIKDREFKIFHLNLKNTHNQMNKIVYCAHSRTVFEDKIDFSGESYLTNSSNENFYYACYVSSEYLDNHVDDSRISFSIPKTNSELAAYISDTNLSLDTIKKEVEMRIQKKLSFYFKKIKKKKIQKLILFKEKNPHARYIVSKFEEEILPTLKVDDGDDKINELFYRVKGNFEYENKQKFDKILLEDNENEFLKTEIETIIDNIEESKKDQLIHYMVYRKCIIQLLEKFINIDEHGELSKERDIHDLIFPMKTESYTFEDNKLNLWIVDEKLSFHSYASSDIPFNKILNDSSSRKRLDVLVCSDTQNGVVHSISIIELKRPFRDKDDPIDQLYEYIEEIRTKQSFNKVPIRANESTIFYCYAICEINAGFQKIVKRHRLLKLPMEIGYFLYNEHYNAFVEVRAYDRIVEDVIRRHKSFFEKLGV